MECPSPTYTALCDALDDEYKARATYRAVIARFGPVLPFVNIVQSEQRHIDALLPLFSGRGWRAPPDRWDGAVVAPESVVEACRSGADAEIENVVLYDRLFRMTDDPEVLSVFTALRRASAERHLPAFQRCLEGDSAECHPGGRHRRSAQGGGCCGGQGRHGGERGAA